MRSQAVNKRLNRREALHLGATACVGAALSGCGGGSGGPELRIFNWSDYIDPELLQRFESQTGARVIYDNYSSDAELETKLLAGGGAYDVVVPSDRSMPALVAKKLLAAIDPALLPNMQHLDEKFLHAPFDPENRYSVPYFWGTVAVGIRSDKITAAADSFAPLFDSQHAGHITMLDDAEHCVAMGLQHLGFSANSVADHELAQVQQLLTAQRPLVQAYTSDSYKEKLITGDAWAALGWSGDLRQAADEEAKIRVVVPREGTTIWLDSLAIPASAPNPKLAHTFLNFMLDPDHAARNAQYVHYATPNQTAIAQLPAEARDDPSVYPPQEVLKKCEWLADRGADIAKVERVWRQVRQ